MARTRIPREGETEATNEELQSQPPDAPNNELEPGHTPPPGMTKPDGTVLEAANKTDQLPPLAQRDGAVLPGVIAPGVSLLTPEMAAPRAPKRYVVTQPGLFSINGHMTNLKAGKVVDDRHYNVTKLKLAGVQLRLLEE